MMRNSYTGKSRKSVFHKLLSMMALSVMLLVFNVFNALGQEIQLNSATPVDNYQVIVSGTVSSAYNGGTVVVWYGLSDGEMELHTQDNTNYVTDGEFSVQIDGLTPGTTYYYQVHINLDMEILSDIDSFITTGTAPDGAISNISILIANTNSSSTVLVAYIVSDAGSINESLISEKAFRYGTTPESLGSTAAGQISSNEPNRMWAIINNLESSMQYYVQSYIIYDGHTYESEVSGFFTEMEPAMNVTADEAQVNGISATLYGSVDNINGVTEYGFFYGQNPESLDDNMIAGMSDMSFSVEISSLEYNTTYFYKAYAMYEGNYIYSNVGTFATGNSGTGGNTNQTSANTRNGHEYVDLGLSVKWATTNVGADNPEETGQLFAWGEVTTKATYEWVTYSHSDGYEGTIDKYYTEEGFGVDEPDYLTTLLPEDDAVTANWGSGWRMPTQTEIQELIDYCSWDGSGNVQGNGNSIMMSLGTTYWSSSLYLEDQNNAYIFVINGSTGELSYAERVLGYPVRGVYEAAIATPEVVTDSVDNIVLTGAHLYGSVFVQQDVPTTTTFGFEYGTDPQNLTSVLGEGEITGFYYSLTGLSPNTTYYYRAYATNTNGTGYGETRTFTTPNETQTGYSYVDLGLPSGTLWATMNIGAESPEDFGSYFAWGETSPKSSYNLESYTHANGYSEDDPQLTKYCNNASLGYNGFTDELTTLEVPDDAATANWGSNWRMPTFAEVEELRDYCSHEFTTQNGVPGTLVTGPNNRSIFIPAAGGRVWESSTDEGKGSYWANSLSTSSPIDAQGFHFEDNSTYAFTAHSDRRYYGYPIRPVYATSQTATNQTGTFIDDRDGRTYNYVVIGDQTWMAENLKYSYNMTVATEGETSETDPYIYYPNGDSNNVDTYGYLYNWSAAMNGESSSNNNPSGVQGICPNGWHLPSEIEWNQLADELGGTANAGAMLAGNYELWMGGDGTNSQYFGTSGFNALPAGMFTTSFENFRLGAWFWTATENNSTSSKYLYTYGASTELYKAGSSKSQAYSIRCVKNDETVAVNPSGPTGTINNHGYVDLGLPSGTMWATTNVGGSNPEDYGNYFAWGETEPKETYNWETYRYCNGSENSLTKYCYDASYGDGGVTDTLTILEASDDAATANWGEGWRMPTQFEIGELVDYCDTAMITYNGVTGMLFTSRSNGNSIFLPLAGDRYDGSLLNTGSNGDYWSSSLLTSNLPSSAHYLYLNSDDYGVATYTRWRGLSVRAVYTAPPSAYSTLTDDRDGLTYTAITIGDQTWMAENLRYGYNLTVVTGGENSQTDPYIYYPNGDSNNVDTYGYLYNWPAAMNGETSSDANPSGVQGICPSGWHLPSDAEWTQLSDYLGTEDVGSKLSGNAELWVNDALVNSPHFGETGFNILPGGGHFGYYDYFGVNAYFWTATETVDNSSLVYRRNINGTETGIYSYNCNKSDAFNIRCVKNVENTASNDDENIIYQCDFETGSEANWPQLNNGDQTNYWVIGDGTGDTHCLYITNDGSSYAYNTDAQSSVYAYKEISLPARTNYHITFDWKCTGENNYDYLRAFIVPTSANPDLTAGNAIGSGWESASTTPEGWFDLQGQMSVSENQWLNVDMTTVLDEGNYYLVFYWQNDGGAGENPPAAVDNISIHKLMPISVTANNVTDKTSTSATLSGSITFIDEPENIPAGFKWGTSENNLISDAPTESTGATFQATLTDLASQTTYYYKAYAVYDGDTAYSDIAEFRTALDESAAGGANNPLTISDINDWQDFSQALQYPSTLTYKGVMLYNDGQDIYFSLESDLAFTEAGATSGIGNFKGNLNGNFNTITIAPDQNFKGVFANFSYGHIDNINLRINSSATLQSGEFGVLCRNSYEASISNCTVSGVDNAVFLSSEDENVPVGGLVGYASRTTISGCTNNLKITSDVAWVGGIAGKADGTIMYCTNNAELRGSYVGGIMAEGAATVTNCLNTGQIDCSGSVAGGISGQGGTINGCMNIGEFQTSPRVTVGGIVGNAESASVTNCANYGAFFSLSTPMGGIAGTDYRSGTYSHNVSAPLFRGTEAPQIYTNTEIYATVGGTSGDETDDFFDEQVGDIKVDSLRLRFAERGTHKATTEIIGSALSTSLSSENWDFTEGIYPKPKNIDETSQTIAARIPIYLGTHQSVFGVWEDFTLPTTIDGQPVTWESDNTSIISISGASATVNRPTDTDASVILTASYQGYSKWFTLTVIGPKHIPVTTDEAWQDSVINLRAMYDNQLEGITYAYDYGFQYSTTSADLSEDVTSVQSHNLSFGETIGFSYPLENIPEGTMVYYRAYATTVDGTEYGEIMSVKALGAPVVVAKYPMWRTDNSASIVFDITLNEEEDFNELENAFYYGTERNNLSLSSYIYYDEDNDNYSVDLHDLAANTKYYYVAEVTNDYGTTRSDTLEFLTCGTMTDSRDNTQYNTIQIGNQTWMAQNLKYVGNIPEGADTSSTVAYRYNPGNFSDVVDEYGYLYNWKATLNGGNSSAENPSGVQGICPPGWHLPSDAEWTQLTEYLGGGDDVPAMLSGQPSGEDQYWQTCDMTESVDFGKSGFNALPTGVYYADYYEYGRQTAFWSVTKSDDIHIYSRYIMGYGEGSISRNENEGPNGYAVRCIKGTAVYAYDTINECMEEPYSYTYHDTTITTSGDYTVRRQIDGDTENIYKLHLTFYPALTATISSFSNGCYGANNGYVEVSAEGGSNSYTYSWNTPDQQTDARLENVGAGEYVVNVTDAVGCSVTASKTLTEPEELAVTINGENPNCYGEGTTLTANTNGGTPDYTYTWNTSATTASISVSPTATTTYRLTVTDANSCTATALINVIVPSQLTVSISGETAIQCYGETTDLTANANGGSMAMGYTYIWSDNTTGQNLTGVVAGDYMVTVTDGSGCTATASVAVTQPDAALTANISNPTNVTCNGASNGSASVTVSGGTTPYAYHWSNNAESQTASALVAGDYNVTVTDANGCTATSSVAISQPEQLTVLIDSDNPNCYGEETTLTSMVNGGTPDYTYTWNTSAATATITVTPTATTTYTLTVTDANGCSVETSRIVTVPSQLTVSISGTTALQCYGGATDLTANANGGSMAMGYTYIWSDNTTGQNLTGVVAGDYMVTVTDGSGCTATASVAVTQPNELTAEITPIGSILCPGGTLSSLSTSISGGTQPYTYLWNNGETTNRLSGPGAGTYSLTVTDANDCTISETITVSDPIPVSVSLTAGNILCHGGTTNITNTISGGSEPYISYAWSNGASVQDLSNISAGTYSVTVKDHYGCEGTATIEITEPDELTTTLLATSISCHGETSDINNTVEGGTTPYTYSWSTGASSLTLNDVSTGNYFVTVTDANNCSATASVAVSQPDELTATLTATDILCHGQTSNITNAVVGGTSPYEYSWSNATYEQNLSGVAAGTYNVTVRDANACTATASVEIIQPDELTTSLSADPILCNAGTTDISNTVAGGTTPYQYFWTDDTHNQNNEGVGAGNYTVTVQDANGCSATSSIAVSQPNALTATLSATEINCHGQTSDITNTVAGGTEPYTYHWSNDADTQDLEGVGGGAYSVTVTDSNACTATASVTVDEPAELTSELSAGTIACSGGTADITNTVSGGTEPITYAWSNNSNTQNLTGVVAGEYSVTVTDAKGCTATASAEITQPEVLAVTLNAGTIACHGQTTTVSTEVEGGTQPYTYTWNNDATTENLTNVGAGTYSVSITDANDCTTSSVVTITEPNELTVTISGPTSVCENTTTTLTANAQGGTTEYTYSWNTSATTNSITTPTITTETPYSVTVTDANGCTASEGVTVVVGDTPGITISDVTPICVGGSTILQANVSNAGTDYTVEWSASPTSGAGLPDNLATDAITVTPTEAGAYTYTVSLTATSCSDGQPFESTANAALTVNPLPDVEIINNADTTELTCNITEISLTATGGTTYQWSNGTASATASITAPETYTVTVTDDNGCTNAESITLTQDVTAPTVTITNTTGTELLTCTTTAINVLAEGTGTSYLWSNDTTTATNTFTEGGIYTVTATAGNGCTSTADIQITPNSDAPALSITNNTGETILTCSLTSIIVTAEGSGSSYEWSNGATTAETTLTEAGTYTVTTTAANGCTASTQIAITTNLEAPEIIATATDSTICQGSSTTLTASGGSSYTWAPETGLPSTVGATLTATPTTTTTYTVTGIGANGCAGSGNVVITVNIPTSSDFTQTACESYEWNGMTYTETGDYEQTLTNANGCDSVVTLHLTINQPLAERVEVTACESYEWNDSVYTASGDYQHTFTAANGCDSVVTLHLTINQPTESNDTVTACGSYEWNGTTYTESGNYQFTMPEANANGCDSVANLYLTINQPTEGNDTVTVCNSYEWYGQTYTETGDYVHTLQSVNGCDSVVNLHLTINSSTAGEFADQMCSGVPYEYEGQAFTEAGTYHVTLVSANGCDSIVNLTLTYSNSCGGIISGVITDAGTDEAIPNARVTVGNQVTRTDNNGGYSLEVVRGPMSLRVSAEEYASYYEAIDIQSDTVRNIALYKPEISMDIDSISVTSYPYLAQNDSITITNTGNTALVWSSVTDYGGLALLPYDEETHRRRNSRALWDSIHTFSTQFNAEQAIATDGFFIYTSSWQRPGEFNRYTPDGEYIETFYIENVGMIRNLSYDGTYFYGTEATNIIFKLDLDNQT
ncbi:MAG: carboxypeptidase-like regulatory domain-containing protein, partial [Bacteroidales bacterium]|nr:carboxypeptidase-like regulatory domain-containing protein [Bacteroidales bacterium]